MAVDYFLKLDGIEGESKDSKHIGWVDLISWGWGATQEGANAAGGGAGAGKVSMHDFHFVQKINKASPKLMLLCATGEPIPTAKLVCRKAGKDQQEYMTVTMTNVLVSSYQTGGASASDAIPSDQISLNFEAVDIEYKEQQPNGSLGAGIKAGYNLKTMTAK